MFLIIKLIIAFILLLLLANDMMHNRGQRMVIKILQFIACIAIISYAAISILETESKIKNNNLFNKGIIFYNEDGTEERETTIGEFLKNELFINILDTKLDRESSEYINGNMVIGIVIIIMFLYWIVLLLTFEKEESRKSNIVDDEVIFEKYNPMLAGCIVQNRNIMCRDIVGVILNLINKGKINIRNVPDKSVKNIGYRYMISENPESKIKLDPVEDEIYDWIFEISYNLNADYISKNQEGIIEIDLIKRLEAISFNEGTYLKLKTLNKIVKKRLNNIGANKESVPLKIKIFNNVFLFINVFLVVNHIISNQMQFELTSFHIFCYMIILIFVILILPLIYTLSLVCLMFIYNCLKTLQEITEGYTGRMLISKAISVILTTFLLITICLIFEPGTYIIYDILLLGITFLIVSTDDYMIKHDYKILNDYYNLKRIEKQISEYSLIKNENIEYLNMWNKYYAYAVAFGIPTYVNEELNISYENLEILTNNNLEAIFYVCKSYLEVMWNVDFGDKKSKINIFKIFG